MAHKDISDANKAYENWLRVQLRGQIVEADLRAKWKKMSSGPFAFMRATYWRWAETILDICPELSDAPATLAVGDIHLENFGVWRDDDGRLVWGVNDFDEAAVMPYALDLVRLAASAALARPSRKYRGSDICAAVFKGYKEGLNHPRAFELDQDHAWLRELLVVREKERARFWSKIKALKPAKDAPPAAYRRAIEAALPEPSAEILKFSPRRAGIGSLGRPRWLGLAEWRGGLVLREAKALVPSAWTRFAGPRTSKLRVQEIARGRYRSPDPWYSADDHIVVRRLSANSRKIEVDEQPEELLNPTMLRAMGHELANIHLGTADRRRAIVRDFSNRNGKWLHRATSAATEFVAKEFKDWRKGRGAR